MRSLLFLLALGLPTLSHAQIPAGTCEFGQPAYGAHCVNENGNVGVLGHEDRGVYGENNNGHFGSLGSIAYGVYGEHSGGNRGILGDSFDGVFGKHFSSGNYGYLGSDTYGAYGRFGSMGNYGYLGSSAYGALGQHTSGNWAALGTATLAAYFQGNVLVNGNVSKSGGSFKIDHPLDPANRYLSHSFVESPDMMDVYNGNVVLDAQGEAIIDLPSYFEALNRDFRYQLTAIGAPGPNLYIAEKISGNRFKIAGGVPGMEVSWQVTGIRRDAWAEAHRIVVEEDKPADEQGFYLHPALYGQPEERGLAWAHDPEGMRAMKEMPQRLEEERRQIEEERARIEAIHPRQQQ